MDGGIFVNMVSFLNDLSNENNLIKEFPEFLFVLDLSHL
jgi:hypothetical protein